MWIWMIEVSSTQGSQSILITNMYWAPRKGFAFLICFNLHHTHLWDTSILEMRKLKQSEGLLTVPQSAIFKARFDLKQTPEPTLPLEQEMKLELEGDLGPLDGLRVWPLSLKYRGGRYSLHWKEGVGHQGTQGEKVIPQRHMDSGLQSRSISRTRSQGLLTRCWPHFARVISVHATARSRAFPVGNKSPSTF